VEHPERDCARDYGTWEAGNRLMQEEVISVASQFGTFLRELRQARQMSISRLAERAAIAKSTLSRWEAGAFQPRLPELEAVLAVLGVSPAQREQAISLVQAPRAVGRLRQEWATSAGPAGDELGAFPAD
jgi:transcriptional regulator with XRE-family HTH domain